jgi:peptide/nickel transport system permease protein
VNTGVRIRSNVRTSRRSAILFVGATLLGFVVLIALVSVFWLPYPLSDTTGTRLEAPSLQHWLGTDKLGRDLLSFLMAGTRIALVVGLGSAALAAVLGLVVGLVAAWAPGWVDDAVSSILDVVIVFPVLLLAMLLGAAQGRSALTTVVAIGLAASAVVARLVRILAKRVMAQRYVLAAVTSGSTRWSITWRHVVPNIWPTVAVNVALVFGVAVLAESTLSYLGLGVPPPSASLGRLLLEAQSTVLTAPVGALAPGFMIVVLVVGANFTADGLRELKDPTRETSR